MGDVANILKRLRTVIHTSTNSLGMSAYRYRNPDGPEAADHIEALTAENERLREALKGIDAELGPPSDWEIKFNDIQMWAASAFLAGEKVSNNKWRKTELRSLLISMFGYFLAAQDASAKARAALEGDE